MAMETPISCWFPILLTLPFPLETSIYQLWKPPSVCWLPPMLSEQTSGLSLHIDLVALALRSAGLAVTWWQRCAEMAPPVIIH